MLKKKKKLKKNKYFVLYFKPCHIPLYKCLCQYDVYQLNNKKKNHPHFNILNGLTMDFTKNKC